MKIRYSKNSIKFLAKQEKSVVDKIKAAVKKLTYIPPIGDIKEMKGTDKGKFRLRVGGYRVIYWYTEENSQEMKIEILYIDKIGNRGDVYK